MKVTFLCPKCEAVVSQEITDHSQLACRYCDFVQTLPAGACEGDRLGGCVVCGGNELFLRKDFSQRLGLTIIAAGFIASSIAWAYYRKYLTFGILAATAVADVLLYMIVKDLLECYRCHAEYRGVAGLEDHERFDLEVYERFRQQEARLKEHEKPAAGSD